MSSSFQLSTNVEHNPTNILIDVDRETFSDTNQNEFQKSSQSKTWDSSFNFGFFAGCVDRSHVLVSRKTTIDSHWKGFQGPACVGHRCIDCSRGELTSRRTIHHNLPANVYECLGNARFSHVTRPRCHPVEEKEWLLGVISRRTTGTPWRATTWCRRADVLRAHDPRRNARIHGTMALIDSEYAVASSPFSQWLERIIPWFGFVIVAFLAVGKA